MSDLIKVTNDHGELLVSARELHEGLGIGKDFSSWIKDIFKYGFEENADYVVFTEKGEKGGRPRIEYSLKLDMAKEICMLQRNEKGRQYRKYLIECEKKLKELDSPSYMIEDPIERARKWIEEQEEKKQLQIELDKSKEWYSIKRVASINDISWKKLDWRKLKRESILQDVKIIKIFDANYGEVNTYHKSVWKAIYPNLKLK